MTANPTHRIHEILSAAWRQRYVIAIPILVMPLLAAVAAVLSPSKFETHTTMLIQETAKLNPFLVDLAVSSNLEERMSALRTLLQSRFILGEVVRELGLVSATTPQAEFDSVVANLSAALEVRLPGKDLIRISYHSNSPNGMREILESVSAQFVEQLLAPERSSLAASEVFLDEQLSQRAEDLANAEYGLAAYKRAHADQLPELHAGNITRLRQLRQRVAERESELAGATRSLETFNEQLARTNPIVGRLEEQIIATRSELAGLRVRYTDAHSQVLGALRMLHRLEEERQQLLAVNSTPTDVDRLWDLATISTGPDDAAGRQPLLVSQLEQLQIARSRVEGLSEELRRLRELVADLETEAAGYGEQERQLSELERDLRVKRRLYEDLLERRVKAQVTGSLGRFERADRVKVIDAPFTPSAPANPALALYLVAGLLAGIALGAGLATIIELLDTTVRRSEMLESVTGVPVLTRVPALRPSGIEGVTPKMAPRPAIAHGFR